MSLQVSDDNLPFKRPVSLTNPAIPEDSVVPSPPPPPPPPSSSSVFKSRLDSYLVVSMNDVSGDDKVKRERERERERNDKMQ